MSTIALAREQQIFVVKETTAGTLVKPSGTDLVLATGAGAIGQETELVEDAQFRNTASQLDRIVGRVHPGEWSFPTYIKPSGSKGTAPEGDPLWEAAFGSKSVSAGNYVRYSLADDVPSLSVWIKKGHTMFAAAGATVNQLTLTSAGNAVGTAEWSGNFMRLYWAGTDTAQSAVSAGATTVTVSDAKRFTIGAYIVLGSDDNSGAGYEITSINYSTNELTFSPGAASGCSAGDLVQPWAPSNPTEVGTPVHGKYGQATVDSGSKAVLSWRVQINNNVKYYEDEKNGQKFASRYGRPGKREVTGTLEMYFDREDTAYEYWHRNKSQIALLLPHGSTDGYIAEVHIDRAEFGVPRIEGDEEVVLTVDFQAVASTSYNDEVYVDFK